MILFNAKDIRISTDSVGFRTAKHSHQGVLIESALFESRAECKKEARRILRELRQQEKDRRDWAKEDS